MENFNDRGTKMILLLEKLLLIATNSKGFANRRKSIIIKETIQVCVVALNCTLFRKHCHEFNGIKYRFGKENIKKNIKEIYQGKIYQTN